MFDLLSTLIAFTIKRAIPAVADPATGWGVCVGGGQRNIKSMRPASAVIFFMAIFTARWGGGRGGGVGLNSLLPVSK